MNITAEQRQQVAAWVAEGANLSEVQRRLESEFSLRMTYMDVRFLIDDLEIELPAAKPAEPEPKAAKTAEEPDGGELLDEDDLPLGAGAAKVAVTIDKITRPGSMASGTVVFSDGKKANWLLDQMGRLGLDGVSRDYRPSEDDMIAFQRELTAAARKMGLA